MKLDEHERRCLEKLGKPYTEVHQFLDQYTSKYQRYHRRLLHHKIGIVLTALTFQSDYSDNGPRLAAELHVLDDLGIGFIPETWREVDSYTAFFEADWEESQMAYDLIDLYGKEFFNEVEQHWKLKWLRNAEED